MTKHKFLLSLRDKLSDLPQDEVEERLHFYSEMIEDRMEEGLSEEEAVSAVGSVDEVAGQIAVSIPVTVGIRPEPPKRQLKAWEIVLLILGAPLWLSLLLAALAVAVSLYVSLWSVIVSLWAAFGSMIGCAVSGVVAGIGLACQGNGLSGIAMLGAGILCAGLAIFLFFGCKAATKGTLSLSKTIARGCRNCFTKKEGV